MTALESVDGLFSRIGEEIARSSLLHISQERISQFAEVTEDRQWIHIDPERAANESMFGGTIAHGFLLISLLPALMAKAMQINGGFKTIVNCGLQDLQFKRPVRSGCNIYATFGLNALRKVPFGVEATWDVQIFCEGEVKTAMKTKWVLRYLR